jgi:hypothetical protein
MIIFFTCKATYFSHKSTYSEVRRVRWSGRTDAYVVLKASSFSAAVFPSLSRNPCALPIASPVSAANCQRRTPSYLSSGTPKPKKNPSSSNRRFECTREERFTSATASSLAPAPPHPPVKRHRVIFPSICNLRDFFHIGCSTKSRFQ